MGLEDWTVVVVGASAGGTGESVVVTLGEIGCSVVTVDSDKRHLEATVEAGCRGPGPRRWHPISHEELATDAGSWWGC